MPSDLPQGFRDYLRLELMLAPTTAERYEHTAREFAAFLRGEGIDLSAVRREEVVHFLRSRAASEETASKAMWNQRLAGLHTFFQYLYEENVVTTNPTDRIERRRLPTRERLPLSLSEMLALVEAAEKFSPVRAKARNTAILQVFLHCSLRVAEVVSLTVPQVDFGSRAFLSVRTKGDQRLSVYFNDVVAEALGKWLSVRKELTIPPEEQHLFLSTRGKQLRVRTVEYLVSRYAKLAGLSRRITPHDLRHSSATEYVEEGTPLPVVQQQLGHASLATTERYVHLPATERKTAVERFGKAWKEAARKKPRGVAGLPADKAGNSLGSAQKPSDGPAAGIS